MGTRRAQGCSCDAAVLKLNAVTNTSATKLSTSAARLCNAHLRNYVLAV